MGYSHTRKNPYNHHCHNKSLRDGNWGEINGKKYRWGALLPLAPLPEQLCFDVNRYFRGEPNLGEGTLEMYAEAMR